MIVQEAKGVWQNDSRFIVSIQKLLIALLILVSVTLLLLLFFQYGQASMKQTIIKKSTVPSNLPLIGGFGIATSDHTASAATDGIQVAFDYGVPPVGSILAKSFQASHMKAVDGYISVLLTHYECYRTAKVKLPLAIQQQCGPYSSVAQENDLLAAIATHLQQEKDNPLITAYWVLDDWALQDDGNAKSLLSNIHRLIQQYTPGRPAICGFAGGIQLYHGYTWEDLLADNFSPAGCDEVGLYIYAPALPNTAAWVSPDLYNWSMEGILPAMFASLQKRGWDIKKEPLIGIGQAFGGPIAGTTNHWVIPTAQDIALQSKSFCEHGATGLVFYAWSESDYSPTTLTPMTSPAIEAGIKSGIAACKAYWTKHP